ncbi:restriction endonuclease subunit S [Veillonella montpellierensis]|uniref:restriction endonuclease subunit S n=1 Tax=Veillonella montpellierensis TaxID=187328 RepID=UPI0023F813CC|nr:restriction endonuclease subunit S [Veillonella montpellierensis]
MYKYHLEDVEWGRFFIKDIFSIENCKCSKVSSLSLGDTPYVGATNRNNGVLSFVKKDDELMTTGNCIAFICDGEGSIGYSIYKGEDFIGSTTVKVGRNKYLNKYNSMFITTISDRVRSKYNFGFKRNEKHLKKEILQLPVDSEGNPNWHFMEEYIKERESKKRQELKDYYKNRLLDLVISPEVLTDVEWREVFIEEIAEIYSGKDIYEKERTMGDTPYITATANNNGIGYFVGNNNKTLDSECISVNRNGSVGYAFYHCYEALYGNDTRKLKPFRKNKYTALFIAHAITSQKDKYGYGYKMGTGRLKRQKIMLPVSDGEINYEYMENFIKNIEKKQIKNVLKYLDEYIYIYNV